MGLFNFEEGSNQKEKIKPRMSDLFEESKKIEPTNDKNSEKFFNEEEYDEDQADLANLDLESAHREADKIIRDLTNKKDAQSKK